MGIRLGNICQFQSGGTPSKSKAEYFNGTIPWITTIALNGGKIGGESAVDWISTEAIRESAAKIVPAFSIMVGTRVGVGKVAINTVDMSTNQDIISLLDINEGAWCKEYLCKFIRAKSAYLNSQARGATIKGIKINVLSELEVPEISREEQFRISRIIDKTQKIIDAHQQQLQKLDNLIKARFVEMFGQGNYEVEKLGTVCKKITDGTHKTPTYLDEGVTFISAKNIINGELDFNDIKHISEEEYQEIQKRCQTEIYDILLSKSGSLGSPAIVKTKKKLGLFESLAVLKYDRERLLPEFLCEQLKTNGVQKQFITGTKGVAIKHLHLGVIADTDIIVPPLVEQKTFAVFVEQVNKSKAAVQKALDEAQLLFNSLMQQYFG